MPRRELLKQKKIVAAIKRAGGGARIRAQTPFTTVGDPDVYGSWHGRHFEFEVKEQGEVPTAIQRKRLKEWKMTGAITAVVRSVDEALKVLRDA